MWYELSVYDLIYSGNLFIKNFIFLDARAKKGPKLGLVSLFGTAYNKRDLSPFCWIGAVGSTVQI